MNIIKLCPPCKDYLWGGEKLIEKYGKKTDQRPCAESWELSFHKDGLTLTEDGEPLARAVSDAELGSNTRDFPFFPTLIKFIDARRDLSVQVHPSDSYALANEDSFGKTEMWYIVEAEEGAGIYLGFSRDVSPEEYEAAIREQRLTELLNFYPVSQGECYFIPSGTIHAIGAGCLICEIQQNSNLTYRVYDYGRRDKEGRERPLHIEKALKVTNTRKHVLRALSGDLLGISKYFTVRKLNVDGALELCANGTTFNCLTCVGGEGRLGGKDFSRGDSFFVPANTGAYKIEGKAEIIMTEIRKYYIGIDLGGTFIKGGIVDDLGNIVLSHKVPTESHKGARGVAENIAALCRDLLERTNMTGDDVVGIGIGVPGMIDSDRGEVIYSNNLGWENFPIAKELEAIMSLPVKIANDANVAALGEAKFGCGKDYGTTVLITLGTGVGGGIVIDGKLFEGNRSAGAELGHSVIVAGGEQCTCGRKGCFEAYASATALIRDTKRAMLENSQSAMWQIGSVENVNGKTAFDYKDSDSVAQAVVDRYIEMLGVGITNIANELRPEAVILGGGVCAEGDRLTAPLQAFVDENIFAGAKGPQVKILTATLGNSAGLLGAAALLQ